MNEHLTDPTQWVFARERSQPAKFAAIVTTIWRQTRGSLTLPWMGLLLLAASSLGAQNFGIDWFTVDGGGGASAGGAYTMSGTIGQPDAGTLSGGTYSLVGGFWGVVALPSAGAPRLFIQYSGGLATISWSPAPAGYVLQVNDTLNPASWANAPSGTANPVSVTATGPARFFRLKGP